MSATAERSVVISNDLGIHLRAAGVFVQVAGKYAAEIWMEREGQRANAKSIMSVLALAASKGTTVTITAEGDDAREAVDALVAVIEGGFKSE